MKILVNNNNHASDNQDLKISSQLVKELKCDSSDVYWIKFLSKSCKSSTNASKVSKGVDWLRWGGFHCD